MLDQRETIKIKTFQHENWQTQLSSKQCFFLNYHLFGTILLIPRDCIFYNQFFAHSVDSTKR